MTGLGVTFDELYEKQFGEPGSRPFWEKTQLQLEQEAALARHKAELAKRQAAGQPGAPGPSIPSLGQQPSLTTMLLIGGAIWWFFVRQK